MVKNIVIASFLREVKFVSSAAVVCLIYFLFYRENLFLVNHLNLGEDVIFELLETAFLYQSF